MPKTLRELARHLFVIVLAATSIILSACAKNGPDLSAQPTSTVPQREVALTPFLFATKTASPFPNSIPTANSIPSPTPTPRTHVVKKGEDMLGIAILYGTTLEELMAANPNIKPNIMSVGAILIIPPSSDLVERSEMPDIRPSPTAIPMDAGSLFCTITQEGGAWCSLPVVNSQEIPLEGISATFRLTDTQNQEILTQAAFLPLDLIYPNQSLPLTAYFPPPIPADYHFRADIISSLPYPDDGRYLPTRINHQEIIIADNQLSASVKLDLSLEGVEGAARRVWVAVMAYDQQGNVVGLRRWENPSDQILNSGQVLSVALNVYSNSGPITRIELASEARP